MESLNQSKSLVKITDIDINVDLKKAKNLFEKGFFKFMNNAAFGKTMKSAGKHRDINLVTTGARRDHLVSEPNYHTTNSFPENLLAIGMKKLKYI